MLSNNYEANRDEYLKRMSASIVNSSKKEIIDAIKLQHETCDSNNTFRILDVGCADGSLLNVIYCELFATKTQFVGIDVDEFFINKAKEIYGKNPIYFESVSLAKLRDRIQCGLFPKFDVIIFSSVLHEISSYADKDAFSSKPIIESLKLAYDCLNTGGRLIIRDGVRNSSTARCYLRFTENNDSRYMEDFIASFKGEKGEVIRCSTSGCYKLSLGDLQEFLCTYTWGDASWPREVEQQFGILTQQQWFDTITSVGFSIRQIKTFSEDYAAFLNSKVIVTSDQNTIIPLKEILFPIIFITALKI